MKSGSSPSDNQNNEQTTEEETGDGGSDVSDSVCGREEMRKRRLNALGEVPNRESFDRIQISGDSPTSSRIQPSDQAHLPPPPPHSETNVDPNSTIYQTSQVKTDIIPEENQNDGDEEEEEDDAMFASRVLNQDELDKFSRLLWPSIVTADDMQRWHNQGFMFSDTHPFGLVQGQGGPCGVLAAVQAEILKLVLFDEKYCTEEEGNLPEVLEDNTENKHMEEIPLSSQTITSNTSLSKGIYPSHFEMPSNDYYDSQTLLATAITKVLNRAADKSETNNEMNIEEEEEENSDCDINIVITSTLDKEIEDPLHASNYRVLHFEDLDFCRAFLLSGGIEHFYTKEGVMLMVYSLFLSKGVENILSEMDDQENTLTGQFGHCTQELLNLLLIGKAYSNVFDGDKHLDEALVLHGIPTNPHPSIGYLSQLEALRYLEVGSNYKIPTYPIWVIGSQSHFSVLFSTSKVCNEENEYEQLLSKTRRIFSIHSIDGEGFIPATKLKDLLIDLEIPLAWDDNCLAALKARIEVAGADLILWEEFWKVSSRLMVGETLEAVLASDPVDQNGTILANDASPINLTGESKSNRPRSDSDFARQLQEQFYNDSGGAGANSSSNIDQNGDSLLHASTYNENVNTRPRSDSDLARELQEQFNNMSEPFNNDTSSLQTNNGSQHDETTLASSSSTPQDIHTNEDGMVLSDGNIISSQSNQGENKTANDETDSPGNNSIPTTTTGAEHNNSKDDDSNTQLPEGSFIMFHYNGLVGPGRASTTSLVKFALIPKVEPRSLIGASIPFAGSVEDSASGFGPPIEQVLSTRFARFRIKWFGETIPSID